MPARERAIDDPLARFQPATATWFAEAFAGPTPVQRGGWQRISAGEHTLMLAPTGSGKTLAAFLWALDRLAALPVDAGPGVRVVYVSPIKALAYDVERNLRAPLAGLRQVAARAGVELPPIVIDVRTGDTSAADRRRQLREPGHILITTPESLYLVLGSQARAGLRTVDTVIVDEIHAVAGSKRGVHLALTLERLAHLVTSSGGRDPQRIGLSATQRPLDVVGRYLGGDRPVAIVDASAPPRLDLQIVVPAADMEHPPEPAAPTGGVPLGATATGGGSLDAESRGMWGVIYPKLLELIRAHRSTIMFVNSRRLAERLSQQLNDLAGEELVRAHHGSIARAQRESIEEALKAGRLAAITATSSLELGIDMGAVDLVVQIESPGAVARGLQRIGRASHHVGGTPTGRIFPKFRGDLLEAAVIVREMLDGRVEPLHIPENCLDVLAQQVVAMCATPESTTPWTVERLEAVVRRTASFRDLSRAALVEVLDMLSGRYPSDEFAELRPRITWDRTHDVLTARAGAKLISAVNAGTIPDRGLFPVHLGEGGPRVGELDEEMVHESRRGETFLLGASTWRIEDITRDRVIVSPAPGEGGKMPFWRGEGPGRPIELGRALGAFVRDLDGRLGRAGDDLAPVKAHLRDRHHLDDHAADNLIAHIAAQHAATGTVPSDRAITVERFRDELGDWRLCLLSPFGARVHAPWALLLEASLTAKLGYDVHPMWTDDGIALRFADGDILPEPDELIPDPDDLEDLLVGELARSSVFASHFRENAARALLLPRRRPGSRTPLWSQRQRAQQLMGVAMQFPSFPIVLETYRECLKDVFDVPALVELTRAIRGRQVRLEAVDTAAPSPFARSLVFDYVAAYLYEGDAPLAERKAQALALDRTLLRQLLGDAELRALLDPEVIAEVLAELQHTAEHRRARHADDLHDLLRRIGDLDDAEVAARAEADPTPWLAELATARRIARVRIAGGERWIAIEDVARYRDALGVQPPPGVPAVFLEPVATPVESLVARWARTRGPFVGATPATRWGLPAAQVDAVLRGLEQRGTVTSGDFSPGGVAREWIDAEVLRQLRRRTLARLRREVEPVEAAVLGRFLPRWHGANLAVPAERRGVDAVRVALASLEGVALSFAELEARILPARIADYHPRMLDELGAAGEYVWVGRGAIGARDGRIVVARRDRAHLLIEAATALPETGDAEAHAILLDHLRGAGASFLVGLEAAAGRRRDAVVAALWDLVWAGWITNDTFAPLRSLGASSAAAKAGGRPRPRTAAHAFGGRWSLVSTLIDSGSAAGRATPTARAHAQAIALLDRHGVASREAALADGVPGGWQGLGDVLRAMEDAGKVRRGYFVEGLGGSQFALPGAVDRLRVERDAPPNGDDELVILAASDPASPWGAALPWPATTAPDAKLGRRVGVAVVQIGGRPVLVADGKGKRLTSFAGADEAAIEHAVGAGLRALARASRRRTLAIETIDGAPAVSSPLAAVLERTGARADYRGFVVDVTSLGRET